MKNRNGFTLIETLIAITIFAIVATAVYSAYINVLDITIASQINSTGLTVIGNEMEVIRNIKYKDIGILNGAPIGIIPAQKNIDFSGYHFILNTTVRNIDDPFDGVLGGTPNDIAPADYKLVELELICTNCPRFIPLRTTTTVGPANLEGSSKNGNLFVNVIDASGQPISGVSVAVTNNLVNPAININDVTNNAGQLQLVDIATSSLGYQIIITKAGYSTERTYKPGDAQNPNPVKPHATVVSHQVTAITFGIDRLSTQTLATKDKFCQAVPNIDFTQQGSKLIGSGPDVYKYSVSDTSGAGGSKATEMEWDSYTIQNTDPAYDLAGTSAVSPFTVNPNSDYTISWMMEPKTASSLMVTAQTSAGAVINDAVVTLSKAGFSQIRTTGHSYFSQSDWSGSQYFQKSQNMEEANPAGELKLKQINGKYASMSWEWLVSSTFDLGTSANFYKLKWNPQSQPIQVGADSLKFQLAANNDNSTWNFVGPDGTSGTFYTVNDSGIFAGHNGNRYLRYKVYLFTQDQDYTPILSDLEIEFSSACIPGGQSFFPGLGAGTYSINIQRSGYQDFTGQIIIGSGWQGYKAILLL